MGFFDKVKNMFTEEVEDDEVKVEKIKNDVTHVAIESPEAKRFNDDVDELEEKITFTREEKENRPVFFDDNDFRDLNLQDREIVKKEEKEEEKEEREIYGSRIKEEPVERKIFKPTPIISPVYGVLDKNYRKEDIVSKSDIAAQKEVESPIDAVRNKAYGTLEDELENTLFGSNSILFKKEEKEEPEQPLQVKEVDDDILSDLTDDIGKELDELLVKKESQPTRSSKKQEKSEELDDDLLGFIDSTLYKNGEE